MGQGKWAIVGALALILAANRLLAADQAAPKSAAQDAESRIEAALEQSLKSRLEFTDAPLNTIMSALAQQYDVPIQFDKPALEAAAASPDQAISVNLSNVSRRSALELMLKDVPDLTYIIDNEVLLITTQDEASKRLEVHVYRVDDLIRAGTGVASSLGDADYDSLIDIITDSVERDSWAENGTGEGEINPFAPGMLIISQTHRVQQQVSELLAKIRSTRDAVLADAAKSDQGDRLITQGIPISDDSLAKDEQARNVIRDVLMRSSDWKVDDSQLAAQVSLDVLPTRIVVRHKPAVVRQVAQTLRDLALVASTRGGAHVGFGGASEASAVSPGPPGTGQRGAPARSGGF